MSKYRREWKKKKRKGTERNGKVDKQNKEERGFGVSASRSNPLLEVVTASTAIYREKKTVDCTEGTEAHANSPAYQSWCL